MQKVEVGISALKVRECFIKEFESGAYSVDDLAYVIRRMIRELVKRDLQAIDSVFDEAKRFYTQNLEMKFKRKRLW